jgi:predicted HTH transcriptional regulator
MKEDACTAKKYKLLLVEDSASVAELMEAMLKKAENVEFKSSLRWDYREGKVNKLLEDVIMKSISAFSNARGGTLFIGVNDDKEIIGLNPDFETLKKKDVDYFELHLRKLINNQYGIRYANHFLKIQFPKFDENIICVIQVNVGDSPLYLKTRNKQGVEVEKFFVRSGNASQEIKSLKEINEYVNNRFEKLN